MTDQTIHATPEQIAEAQRILANAAIPVQHAERVAEVTNGTRVGMTTDAVAQLIQDARGALGVTPAADPSIVEAASPEHVNALLAAQSDLKAIIDDATKKRAEIQKIFRDMLADADQARHQPRARREAVPRHRRQRGAVDGQARRTHPHLQVARSET
jgi:hypothetical protein